MFEFRIGFIPIHVFSFSLLAVSIVSTVPLRLFYISISLITLAIRTLLT